jgi:hypothetical protein
LILPHLDRQSDRRGASDTSNRVPQDDAQRRVGFKPDTLCNMRYQTTLGTNTFLLFNKGIAQEYE